MDIMQCKTKRLGNDFPSHIQLRSHFEYTMSYNPGPNIWDKF